METIKIIFEAIKNANKPVKPGEISEITGIDKKEVEKVIKQLTAEAKIYSPKRCFYEVKK